MSPRFQPPSQEVLDQLPWLGEGPDPRGPLATAPVRAAVGWSEKVEHYRDEKLGDFDVSVVDHEPEPFAGGFLPRRFELELSLEPPSQERPRTSQPRYRLEIETIDGRPRCAAIRSVEGELTGEALRKVPVAGAVKAAAWTLARHPEAEQIAPAAWMLVRFSEDEVDEALARRGPGVRVPDAIFAEVARVYAEAERLGLPPTNYVEQQLHCSRPTAGRWVMIARRRGLLPPARAI